MGKLPIKIKLSWETKALNDNASAKRIYNLLVQMGMRFPHEMIYSEIER